jgi:hypothetical protein
MEEKNITGGKPIAVPLVAFDDIHEGKREELFLSCPRNYTIKILFSYD